MGHEKSESFILKEEKKLSKEHNFSHNINFRIVCLSRLRVITNKFGKTNSLNTLNRIPFKTKEVRV